MANDAPAAGHLCNVPTGLQPLWHKTSLCQAHCRHQFKKSIIRSRAGSPTPQLLHAGKVSVSQLMSGAGSGCVLGHVATLRTLQKGKRASAAARLLTMQALVRVAIKAGPVVRQGNPSAVPQELTPSCIRAHCTSLHLHFFFTPLYHLSLPLPISIPLPSHCSPNRHFGDPQGVEGKGGRSCQHSHVAQVRVLGKGARLDVS